MGLIGNSMFVQHALQSSQQKLMPALATASARVRSGEADAAIKRWFGDDAIAQKSGLAKTIDKFRSNINVKSISVGYDEIKLNPAYGKASAGPNKVAVKPPKYHRTRGMNAAAYASPDSNVSMNLGDMLSHVPGQTPVFLGTGFAELPELLPVVGGAIVASDWRQSKFNTLVHELSHLLLGTEDVEFDDGSTAYGTQAAELLATFGSGWAFKNAENWGIFIEAAGVQKNA